MDIFETISFHVVKPCNMVCKYCYATFEDFKVSKQITLEQSDIIISKLEAAGVKKITFAGGEPMLWKPLESAIIFSKLLGMTTSIITNGTLITDEWLARMEPYLDWIGISVDSVSHRTNLVVGRQVKDMTLDYYNLVSMIRKYKYKLKINTVVSHYNWFNDMNGFINYALPERWKVFQALRIEGQNDTQFDEIKVSAEQYENFLNIHSRQPSLVPEDNEAMTGSYLLIDPLGRMFENTHGIHTYSDSLINHSVEHCLNQITLNRDTFIKRGGIYNW